MSAARELAKFDFSDSWLLRMEILPSEVVLECDVRVIGADTARHYQLVRFRFVELAGLTLNFDFPRVTSKADDIGSIYCFEVLATGLKIETSYGTLSASSFSLSVEPQSPVERAEA